MLLSLSSLFLSLIVYHYCYDDKTPLLQCSARKEYENDCLDNRLNYETLTTHSYRAMSYGTWLSPISSALIVENTITPSEIRLDENGNAYWLELRPSESGRYVICSNKQPEQKDILEKPFNSRTRVHEYGGGSYLVKDDVIYFSNFADQRLYQINTKENNVPVPITEQSENASLRYADYTVDSFRKRLVCVHEVHQGEHDVQNSIASVSLNDSSIVTLASGYDFYSSPRISPDGRYLVWICWNHPNMPWDQTELWIGEFSNEDNSSLINKKKLFGQTDESILQPEWSPDGKFIYFVSDKNDWWNIYRASVDGQNVEHVYDDQAEFGGPSWVFGGSYYGFDSNGNLVSVYWKNGIAKLCRIDVQTKKSTPLTATEEYTDIRSVRVNNQTVYFVGSSAVKPAEVVEYNFETDSKNVLFRSTNITIDTRYLSVPEMITFKTGNDIAYGIYYPPKNDDYPLPASSTELPPLLVRTHGGPTSATTSAFNLRIQYWTSRGFALLDVNYRGSTGYGRKFRDSLRDHWGIYDVQDAIAGAEHLVQQNKADRNRLTIDGGSAGGYTTLCALTMYDFFSAGASHYGVSDLELLAKDTHKFESRYLDRLVGEYPAKRDIYIERSPMTHVKKVSKPIIFFQGSEDKIVLPSQAEVMVNALREKHLPVAYVLFDGEQHGFRKAENIRRSLDGQFYFFSRIFRFQMADHVEPIEIENFSDD